MSAFHNITNMFNGGGGAGALLSPATRALAMLDAMALSQATMLAYLDVFKIMAIGCVPVVVLCLLLKKMKHHHADMGH